MTNHICNCANRPKDAIALCTNCGGDIVSVGIMNKDMRAELVKTNDLKVTRERMSNVYEKEIWNGAIEQAISVTAKNLAITSSWLDKIRKLKK